MKTEEEMAKESKNDFLLQMCCKEGWVPANCYLPGQLVYQLISKGEDPCDGCKGVRRICGGTRRIKAVIE